MWLDSGKSTRSPGLEMAGSMGFSRALPSRSHIFRHISAGSIEGSDPLDGRTGAIARRSCFCGPFFPPRCAGCLAGNNMGKERKLEIVTQQCRSCDGAPPGPPQPARSDCGALQRAARRLRSQIDTLRLAPPGAGRAVSVRSDGPCPFRSGHESEYASRPVRTALKRVVVQPKRLDPAAPRLPSRSCCPAQNSRPACGSVIPRPARAILHPDAACVPGPGMQLERGLPGFARVT